MAPASPTSPLRQAISLAYRRDEASCVEALGREMAAAAPDAALVADRARALVAAVREQRRNAGGVDHLMHEFSLSSQEGIALMCLAEALLRIPDSATADRLIRDKIGKGDWLAHLGRSQSLFVNAASWGLMITGKLVSPRTEADLSHALTRLVARGGEPLVRRGVEFAMRLLGQQFVIAETIEAALLKARNQEARGYTYSFDMLGEAALTSADARTYYDAYEAAIHAIGRAGNGRGVAKGPGISVKLSALHPRYQPAQRARVLAELLPRLQSLARLAKDYDMGLNIDAEESERLELSLDLLEALTADPALAGWDGLGFVAQAYQKRSPFVVDYLAALARRSGRRLMVRLVKGAYWDSEIKRSQVDGQAGYPVYTRKVHTDLAYLCCAKRLLEASDVLYPQFATHNAHTLVSVMEMARIRGVEKYEFQCLHGMGEPLYDNVVGPDKLGRPCRIYAPVGSHRTLLPYLVRRLLENGANSSFVNRLLDETTSIDELVRDPLGQVRQEGGQPHPKIPLPRHLFGADRLNSLGLDFSDENTLASVTADLDAMAKRTWSATSKVAGLPYRPAPSQAVTNPANRQEQVGSVVEASPDEIEAALAAADGFSPVWHAVPPSVRAAMLERAANLLEAHRSEFISLCVREAGKTWGNGQGEVREAADFCRYYARQIAARPAGEGDSPPGPVVCISPWNFPLAIFVGQVAAALAAGSPVLAKPAEQTPLTAAFAVSLFHRAGIPPAALQFLPGRGEMVGALLTADPRVKGVIFTGSTEVAQAINRSLAKRSGLGEIRLIAETGGQNALVVDSSALPEQVVQDVLTSGFDSAGQRCSALRILCLQADIADRIVTLLKEAMGELAIGDPRHLCTDIGPVIDEDARARLEEHVASMKGAGKTVFRLPLPPACADGSFVAPTLIEIDSLAELKREVFGPVVHVLRYPAGRLEELVQEVNGTGYGLTFGIHSRIDETVEVAARKIRAGNIYVNRNMIGAVVGVQPFGGEGLSGTGPKAGGPLYLHRLMGSPQVLPWDIGLEKASSDDGLLHPLQALARWALETGRTALADACTRYAGETLLPYTFFLPGPTGERNTLSFAPWGPVLCFAATPETLLDALAVCLATGNDVRLEPGPVAAQLLTALPSAVQQRIAWWDGKDTTPLAAVLCADDNKANVMRQAMAAREGALVPVLICQSGGYPLYRLLAERVITINTTAAGGNTSLMTLA